MFFLCSSDIYVVDQATHLIPYLDSVINPGLIPNTRDFSRVLNNDYLAISCSHKSDVNSFLNSSHNVVSGQEIGRVMKYSVPKRSLFSSILEVKISQIESVGSHYLFKNLKVSGPPNNENPIPFGD